MAISHPKDNFIFKSKANRSKIPPIEIEATSIKRKSKPKVWSKRRTQKKSESKGKSLIDEYGFLLNLASISKYWGKLLL